MQTWAGCSNNEIVNGYSSSNHTPASPNFYDTIGPDFIRHLDLVYKPCFVASANRDIVRGGRLDHNLHLLYFA